MTVPFDDGDFVLRRFRRRLVTQWWIPLGLAVGLAVAASTSVDATFTTSVVFRTVQSSSTLSAVDFDSKVLSEQLDPRVDASVISGSTFADEVASVVGTALSASVASDENSVTVTLSGAERTAVEAARQQYVDRFVDVRSGRFGAAVDAVIARLEDGQLAIDQRLADLDAQLGSLTDASSSLAGALTADRSQASEQRLKNQAQLDALRAIRSNPDEIVAVSGSSSVVESKPVTLRLVAGVSLGAVLGLAILYLFAMLDRSIRTRADVETGGSEVLGVLARGDRAGLERTALVIAGRAAGSSDGIHVVPVDAAASADAAGLGEILTAVAPVPVDVLEPYVSAPDALRSNRPIVLLARYGRTAGADLEQAVREVRLAGGDITGAVLAGVPRRDQRFAMQGSVGRRSSLY